MRKSNIALIAAATFVAATSAASAQDVKMGILMGFTGPLEQMSPPMAKAAQLVATQVNAQGGILKGGKLSFVQADDTCTDATAATNAADRLVNTEKVLAIVGAMCSGVTIATANTVAIPANVVMISPSATAPTVSSLNDKDLVFRTSPSDSYQGEVIARLLNIPSHSFDGLLAWVLELRGRLGIAHSLADIGVDLRNVKVIGEEAARDPSAGGNPIPVDAAVLEKIFRAAVAGDLEAVG